VPYVSLYRKYRPQKFSEVVGQDHVTRTLSNAIRDGRLAHAFLFAGPRGTGKTSTARILAKALNCESGPAPEPCGTCGTCLSITAGSSLDVVEIDAASHGLVEDARDLREKALFAPAYARSKIYIIDEAHMVSAAGFNALLKILEDPPSHVVFVFATTEPHKVLKTIVGRCQRYDFRRVPTNLLAEHLTRICASENIKADAAALSLIARAADGSVRDGLSMLDQLVAYCGESIALADATSLLGRVTSELLLEMADVLASRQPARAFGLVDRLVNEGHDLRQFTRESIDHLRNLFLLRVAPESPQLVDATDDMRERLAAQSHRFEPGELARDLRLLSDAHAEMRGASNPRLALEVYLVRCLLPEAATDPAALLARLERLERRIAVGAAVDGFEEEPAGPAYADLAPSKAADRAAKSEQGPAPSAPAPPARRGAASAAGAPPAAASEPQAPARRATRATQPPPAAPAAPAAHPAGKVDLEMVKRSWPEVLSHVKTASRVAHLHLSNGAPLAMEGHVLELEFPRSSAFHGRALESGQYADKVTAAIEELFGIRVHLRCTLRDDVPEVVDEPLAQSIEDIVDPEAGAVRLNSEEATKAVVDLVKRGLGGEVIEEIPNRSDGR